MSARKLQQDIIDIGLSAVRLSFRLHVLMCVKCYIAREQRKISFRTAVLFIH